MAIDLAAEKNSTIIFPAQFMTTVREAIAMLNKDFSFQIASNPLGSLPDQLGETAIKLTEGI